MDIRSSDEYGRIRQWVTATDCAVEDPERVKGWGRRPRQRIPQRRVSIRLRDHASPNRYAAQQTGVPVVLAEKPADVADLR